MCSRVAEVLSLFTDPGRSRFRTEAYHWQDAGGGSTSDAPPSGSRGRLVGGLYAAGDDGVVGLIVSVRVLSRSRGGGCRVDRSANLLLARHAHAVSQ